MDRREIGERAYGMRSLGANGTAGGSREEAPAHREAEKAESMLLMSLLRWNFKSWASNILYSRGAVTLDTLLRSTLL